jgi:Protein of unknown function (DUF1439)
MKKIVGIIVFLLVVSLVGAYFYFSGKEYIIRIPEKDIQVKMNEKLPITKSYFLIFQVTLENPRVMLEEGSNRVNAGLDTILNITVENQPKPLGGSLDISGNIKYVDESGEFYLVDPVIEKFNIQGIPEIYTDKANSVITKALSEFYAKHPVYTLSALNAKESAAKMVLKKIIIENKELVVTLGI